MSEEERLFAEVEKLEVGEGDVVLIKAARIDAKIVEELRPLGEALSGKFKCLVVMIGPEDCITSMDEDTMDSYGWVRKTVL